MPNTPVAALAQLVDHVETLGGIVIPEAALFGPPAPCSGTYCLDCRRALEPGIDGDCPAEGGHTPSDRALPSSRVPTVSIVLPSGATGRFQAPTFRQAAAMGARWLEEQV